MLTRPIRLDHDDGWQTEFTDQVDGTVNVLVTAPSGRSWATNRPTLAAAIEVDMRIREEQAALDQPATPDGA